MRYAVLHPDRVSYLVLNGGSARGPSARGVPIEFSQAFIKLLRDGWGHENPAFRLLVGRRLLPNASDEEIEALDNIQRVAC